MIRDSNDLTTFKWATVRNLSPLAIQLDGDPAPLALIPDTLVDPQLLSVGSRVRVELSLRKVVIHGVANGPLVPSTVKSFDLATARLEYGGRANRAPSENRVMQSVFVSSYLEGEIWYSQVAAGTVSGRESTTVVRCTPQGAVIGEMYFQDAGHGTGMFVEANASGIWVWLSFINQSISSGPGRYNYVRVPWVAGATRTWANVSSLVIAPLSGGDYGSAHFDEKNSLVGWRSSNAAGTVATFSQHTLANLKAGINSPTDVFSYTWGSDYYGQGWALLDRKWYVLVGSSEETTPSFAWSIWRLEPNGTRSLVRSIERARQSPWGGPWRGFSEPEGLAVARGAQGEPVLVFGVSDGPTGGRGYTFWRLHHGATPFVSQDRPSDFEYGDTGWSDNVLVSLGSGVTKGTGGQTFLGRLAGGYLELKGTLNGSFPAGTSTVLANLRDGWYSTSRHCRAVQPASTTSATNSLPFVRIELNVSGQLSIVVAGSDTAKTWVDLTGIRFPLI